MMECQGKEKRRDGKEWKDKVKEDVKRVRE